MDTLNDINTQFPSNQEEFEQLFPTEEACVDYLIRVRWPNGVSCPRCQCEKLWRTGHQLICSSCRYQVRVMAGTIFQDSHQPLMVWFKAMWFVVGQKFGTNVVVLHKALGLSYGTAWTILHKLLRAMVRPGRERLSGIVEVDQAYVGEATRDSPGRKADQALVVLGVEVKDKSFGQARLRVVNSATLENITGFIKDHVEPGSTVITDGWKSYAGLKDNGYLHQIGKAIDDQEALRQVQRLIWLLKRWFLGTCQGAATKKYLDYYLDEYTFRFNRRKSGSCGQLFLALMEQVVVTGPVTCQALISPIGEAIGITLEDDEFGG